MKILFINYEYPPLGGGGGVFNKLLAEELAKKHKICILTSRDRNLVGYETEKNIDIYRSLVFQRNSQFRSSFISLLTFPLTSVAVGIEVIHKFNPDIIHSFFVLPSGITGNLLSRLSHLPHVVTIIGGDIYDPTSKLSPNKNLITRFIVSKILSRASKVVAISTDVARRAEQFYRCKSSEKQIAVIPPGIKPINFPYRKKNFVSNPDIFVVTVISRLVKRKRVDCLLRAIARLVEKKVYLYIIGDGPDKSQLELLTRKLKIDNFVEFTGFITEHRKYEILSKTDCFVLNSLYEGFGIVYLEAMQFGLPIIASKVGGQTDFLENGRTGFLIPKYSIKAIADSILMLIEKTSLREKISKYNKRKVRDYYITKIVNKYEKLYCKVG